jgi:hypothetical protein
MKAFRFRDMPIPFPRNIQNIVAQTVGSLVTVMSFGFKSRRDGAVAALVHLKAGRFRQRQRLHWDRGRPARSEVR